MWEEENYENQEVEKMTEDRMQELGSLVIAEAKARGVSCAKAMAEYRSGYHVHKAEHGSFKNIENYQERMNERYEFMYNRAIDYVKINTVKK